MSNIFIGNFLSIKNYNFELIYYVFRAQNNTNLSCKVFMLFKILKTLDYNQNINLFLAKKKQCKIFYYSFVHSILRTFYNGFLKFEITIPYKYCVSQQN